MIAYQHHPAYTLYLVYAICDARHAARELFTPALGHDANHLSFYGVVKGYSDALSQTVGGVDKILGASLSRIFDHLAALGLLDDVCLFTPPMCVYTMQPTSLRWSRCTRALAPRPAWCERSVRVY